MKIHIYYIYILSNKYDTVLYIGVTNDLVRRCHEHKAKLNEGFTKKYNVDKLVYYEVFDYIESAIAREKQIKKYSRKKKDLLIDKINPKRIELYNNGIKKSLYNIEDNNKDNVSDDNYNWGRLSK